MHIALKSIKKLFQNLPKIIKNLHQIASKSIFQRPSEPLWAPLMRPLAPFWGEGDPRGAQIGPSIGEKWSHDEALGTILTPGVPKSAQVSTTSGKRDLLDPPLGDPFWESKLQEKVNLFSF